MSDLPQYELFAIRYATRDGRRRDHFIGGDPHDAPMPMDYFVWVAKGPERNLVIDSGFTPEVSKKRGRTFLRDPVDTLRSLGVDPDKVEDVVLTHLHYDHVGNFHRFPAARFHLQAKELAHATGPYMRFHQLSHAYEVDDVVGIVRMNYASRVVFHDGAVDLFPGVSLHLAGGHAAGLQFLRIHTRRGWVVLASDVTHFYANLETGKPYVSAFHIGEMVEGFERLRTAAPSEDHIIPGHDPEVMRRYPAPSAELEGVAVRLDVAPRKS